MIALAHISPSELEQYIRIAFDGDEELLSAYHISPGDLEHCVIDTMLAIKESAEYYKEQMECYKLACGDKEIGYSVIIRRSGEPDELYSFGINIEYRNAVLLKQWVVLLKDRLSKVFYLVLWSKNTRAIEFFVRNGMVQRNEHNLGNDKTLLICPLEDL